MSKYSEQVKSDAAKAAQYIRRHGWCQYDEVNERGNVCMNGAIRMVSIGDPGVGLRGDCPLYDAACDEVGIALGSLGAVWNDAPGRTKEEVLAVFDRIANA